MVLSIKRLAPCDHYAGTETRMRKALALQQKMGPVFDITFDCEDGAPRGNEKAHAQQVAELINSPDNLFNRVGVRIHSNTHSAFAQDIAILVGAASERLAYITLPKVNSAQEVREIIARINTYAKNASSSRLIPIHVLIETHGALREVEQIAALEQVECLSFGLMDYVSEYQGAIPATAMASPGQFEHPITRYAMRMIAMACHAHGKVPSHNVSTNIANPEEAKQDALRARWEFAYLRKWSIHPQQIVPIIQGFAPTTEEIKEAISILLSAQDADWGPIQFNGKLHDYASYRYYWIVLQSGKESIISDISNDDKVKKLLTHSFFLGD